MVVANLASPLALFLLKVSEDILKAYSFYKKAVECVQPMTDKGLLADLYFKYALSCDDLDETEDAVMACKKEESQDVKKLYDRLNADNLSVKTVHKTVFRPWGYYTCLADGEGYLTKIISVSPKQKLSIQSHNHRSEHWVVLEGRALVVLDGKNYNLEAGQSIDIPLKAIHSLQNPYDKELRIIEVQKGDYISEDDIIRYEDAYGRV